MDTDALRREISTLVGLLHNLPDTDRVGSPHVEEYGRALDRFAALGIDVDAYRLQPEADGADAKEPEVERAHMLMQGARLASYIRLVLKRKTRGSARGPRGPRGDALN